MTPVYLKQQTTPIVSIGLPVFNGEKSLRNAIDSLFNQTFQDFALIISDNASTDETEKICLEYAKKDDRIRFFRQTTNIGAANNFSFVLQQANGKYFMWAADDDTRSTNFIAENLFFLESHSDFVASTSPVKFEGGSFNSIQMGDISLDGTISERLKKFFNLWHANGRFYSLIRRKQLINCSEINKFYLGSDWSIMLFLLTQGKMNRLETGWVSLGINGISHNKDFIKTIRSYPIELIVPFWFLSQYVFKLLKKNKIATAAKLSILLSLIKYNIRALYVALKSTYWKK